MNKTTLATALLATTLIAPSALAYNKGDMLVRVGATNVSPDDSSSNVNVAGNELPFGVGVDDNTQLGLNFAVFIADHWALEVLAATPFKHDVDFSVSDPLGTGDNLGEVSHLPPTFTVNYFFMSPESNFQPYVGAGVNYTIFFDEEFSKANKAAGFSKLDLDNSFGLSAQVGADYFFNEKWFMNGSVRYIDIDTDARFKLGESTGKVSVDIDPWVYTVSVGYKF